MRTRIRVEGIVQGVGFRPYVYSLAREHGLDGWVRNATFGVVIEVEGAPDAVDRFVAALPALLPAAAEIDELTREDCGASEQGHDSGFSIKESLVSGEQFVLVPSDQATCAACAADLGEPGNRRRGYPFTNCTHCGPRYTIIEDVPYDRPATTMREFIMCDACRREYEDPRDRRFHAQPNACPACGPHLELRDRAGVELAIRDQALERTRALLAEGAIVAVKGLGGFHLACDASNDAAVRRLRERKRRVGKPFAVMVADTPAAERICAVSDVERRALESVRRPIVILRRHDEAAPAGGAIAVSDAVAPGNDTLGVMLAYTPLHQLLFDGGRFEALVMTSGNLSEEPIAALNLEARTRLAGVADYFLLHNRLIRTRVDDSVVRVFAGRERVLRRSRGWAPHPVPLHRDTAEILAVGGDLKNTFCLTRRRYALLSQHIGDLENLETLEVFNETLEHMKRFFRVTPRAVAHDLHPGYHSTRIAAAQGLPLIAVQHHHAHIAASMAEHRLPGPAIGVALDGTGYGTDGAIWGGEVLVCRTVEAFERRAHFRYMPLAGGDAAARQPWRSALGALWSVYGQQAWGMETPATRSIDERTVRVVGRMIETRVQTVETSSCGRLFDAVAALAGVCRVNTYEAQAAIELEALARGVAQDVTPYPFAIDRSGEPWLVDFRETIAAVAAAARSGVDAAAIAARFHATVAAAVVACCRLLAAAEGIGDVCLSGGSFQNATLAERVAAGLAASGLRPYLHSRVPPNDGGLSLGQAVVAGAALSH
jgi:hydrogenase maturation protein HypF